MESLLLMNKAIAAAMALIVATATLPSCSVGWRGAESSEITEEAAVDAIMKEHFPEIFRAKEAGVVHVDGIIKSVNRKGEIRYKVDYDYHPLHSDGCD